MKIGLIADVHGNSVALLAVWDAIVDEVDKILFLGDLCGYYPFVEACSYLWESESVIGIRGNHDQILLECIQEGANPGRVYRERYGSALARTIQNNGQQLKSILETWPTSCNLRLGNTNFSLFHGAPWAPLDGRVYPDFSDWEFFNEVAGDVILLGHTHYPLIKSYGDKLIVNPGSVGQPRDQSSSASYAIYDTDAERVYHHRVSFNPKSLIDDALEHDPELPYLVEVLVR